MLLIYFTPLLVFTTSVIADQRNNNSSNDAVSIVVASIAEYDKNELQSDTPVNSTVKPEINDVELKSSGKKSMAYYKKVHSYLIRTKVHKYYSLQDTIDHVDHVLNWTAPRELEEKFPYYLSGYNYDDQPVWIAEVGKFNLRRQIEKGPEAEKNVSLYLYTFFYNVLDSMLAKDTPEREIRRAVFIGDFEDFDVTQASHIPTLQFALHEFLLYRNVVAVWVSSAVGFNVSYLTALLFQSIRPLLGGILENIEVYGTNSAKWKLALQRLLPPEVVPSWYGGRKDYKPIRVFG